MTVKKINKTEGIQMGIKAPSQTILDSMSKEQFDAMMQKGYDEAQAGIGLSVDEVFKKIREVIGG